MALQSIANESMTNILVEHLSDGSAQWKGDVLVVKSKQDSPELVINMEQADVKLVNLLLWRYVWVLSSINITLIINSRAIVYGIFC